jgi:thiamine biosynthesis lipoprotein
LTSEAAVSVPGQAAEAWSLHGFEGTAMASALRLFVHAEPGAGAVAAAGWQVVRDTFEATEQALSRFRDSSDLTWLNRRVGRDVGGAPRLLVRALAAADRAHRRTAGRFDPRVLAHLERLGYPGAQLPGGVKVPHPTSGDRIVHRVGRSGTIRIDQAVDLGGIGKGLALRWAAADAERALAPILAAGGGFLVDAGRDLVGRGEGPDGRWLIDIEDPLGNRDALAVISLPPGGAVATSSIRLRRWTAGDGRPAHHLVDPRTGEPGGAGLVAVTVAGQDPAWAEVWSKTLFLEGEAGIAAAARREGLAAWWAAADGRFELTPAARPLTLWLASEAG